MFAKSKLATAVAAALGVSALGIQSAQADSVFFPYIAGSPVVTTIVSTINTGYGWGINAVVAPNPVNGGGTLHYHLYYKDAVGGSVEDLANCTDYNLYLPTSWNDIQSVDLTEHFGGDTQGVLFNDDGVNNKWKGQNRSYAMAKNVMNSASSGAVRGYLYVDNADGFNQQNTLAGEAFVFQFGDGAAFGYAAPMRDGDNASAATYNANYLVAAMTNGRHISLLPLDEFSTAFFVTPVSANQQPYQTNAYRARVDLDTTGGGDLYDRDEVPVSGTRTVDVTCVARVDLADMIGDGALYDVETMGGWGRLYAYRLLKNSAGDWKPAVANGLDSANAATTNDSADLVEDAAAAKTFGTRSGASVLKLEYNKPGVGTFDGTPVGGTYNNAYLLP